MIKQPQYIGLEEARQLLAQMGVRLTLRQMQRAAEQDAQGRRKLPFFVDPIERKLKIEKNDLISISKDRLKHSSLATSRAITAPPSSMPPSIRPICRTRSARSIFCSRSFAPVSPQWTNPCSGPSPGTALKLTGNLERARGFEPPTPTLARLFLGFSAGLGFAGSRAT